MIALLRRRKPAPVVTYTRCIKCGTPVVADPDGWDRLCDPCFGDDQTAPVMYRTVSGWHCTACPATHHHGHLVNGERTRP